MLNNRTGVEVYSKSKKDFKSGSEDLARKKPQGLETNKWEWAKAKKLDHERNWKKKFQENGQNGQSRDVNVVNTDAATDTDIDDTDVI